MSTAERTTTATTIPAGVWRVDPAHSNVGFAVRHMMITTVRGHFGEFDGTLEVDESGAARARGRIAAASIETGDTRRDAHLRSADFFDVEEFPEIRFEARAVEPLGDAQIRMTGYLTIRGMTRTVELDVAVQGAARDPWGNDRLGLEVGGEIDREDFGLRWNQALESGGLVLGSKVRLELDLSTIRDTEPTAA